MFQSTGDPRLKSKTDYLVAELAKCQAAAEKAGFHPGYLSAFPESFFDRVDAGKRVWAPWYTMHKIMAGLLDVNQHTGNAQALVVLRKLADWVKFRVDRLPVDQMQASLKNEQGGMTEVLANLAAAVNDPDYLRISEAFNHHAVIDPLARGEDQLDGLHANTQIPKIIGAAREYELTGDPEFRTIAQTFWTSVALHRSYAFGGHSDGEHFFPIKDFARHLSVVTAETCNVYNMLKLTRHLFEWNADENFMEFYERALFNQILGSQEPDLGMMTYFISTKPGHFKVYMTPLDSFWCCSGTGVENHAKYGDTIYFHDVDSLYVNLFIASELHWTEKGLVVRQETQFPTDGNVMLTMHCAKPISLNLRVRHPAWAGDGFAVAINGDRIATDGTAGSYVSMRREWHDGDRVQLTLPMTLHVETLPGVPDEVAVMVGPIVLAGDLGPTGIKSDLARAQSELNKVPDPPAPVFVGAASDIVDHISPVADQPLTFLTQGLGKPADVKLLPFYLLHHRRYTIYWKLLSPAEWNRQGAVPSTQQASLLHATTSASPQ